MGWKIEAIKAERLKLAAGKFAGASPDVLDHIAEVETALYCLAYPLSELDMAPAHRCNVWMSSKMFPAQFDDIKDGEFAVYDKAVGDFKSTVLPTEKLHEVDYATAEGINLMDGTKISDDFEILSVHQNAPCAYVGCGSIWMKDVRRAAKLLWPNAR